MLFAVWYVIFSGGLRFPGLWSPFSRSSFRTPKVISSLPHISPIKSHFSGISHDQTPAMATRINLILFEEVSRCSKYPLLRNSDEYSNFQNPSRLAYNEAYNEFGHGWSTVHLSLDTLLANQ